MPRPKINILHEVSRALPARGRLLLAVSGGIDSVTLLHAVNSVREALKLQIEVAHVDHRFRPESGSESAFVEALAAEYGLIFHVTALAPLPGGVNLERWAREERYAYFSRLLIERDLDFVLTAHTANDVAETLLMRLVSNKELRTIHRSDQQRRCLRPFLSVPRTHIENYAKEHSLKYVVDPSNEDLSRLRSRVRHELIPILQERFDPKIVETIANRAVALAEDDRYLNSLVTPALKSLSPNPFGSKPWMIAVREQLESMNSSLQWRLIEAIFLPRLGFKLGRRQAAKVIDVICGRSQGFELPGGVRGHRSGGGLVLS